MATLGERLRLARERAGLSIDDMAARTKIQLSLLEAMERNDFSRLPGGLFVRGFLRAYAREAGLDPEAVVADYLDQYEPVPPGDEPSVRTPTASGQDVILAQPDFQAFSWRKLIPAAGVMALLIGLLTIVGSNTPDAPVAEAGAVATTGTAPAPPPAEAPKPLEPMTLDLRARRDVWVAATVDGRRAMYRILKAGEHATLTGRETIDARIGDAEALEYAINGRPGQPLGAAAEVRDIILTPGGFRTLKVDRPPKPQTPESPE